MTIISIWQGGEKKGAVGRQGRPLERRVSVPAERPQSDKPISYLSASYTLERLFESEWVGRLVPH